MKTIKHLLLGGFSLLLLSCGGKKSGDQPVENISEVPEYPITISFAKGIDTAVSYTHLEQRRNAI